MTIVWLQPLWCNRTHLNINRFWFLHSAIWRRAQLTSRFHSNCVHRRCEFDIKAFGNAQSVNGQMPGVGFSETPTLGCNNTGRQMFQRKIYSRERMRMRIEDENSKSCDKTKAPTRGYRPGQFMLNCWHIFKVIYRHKAWGLILSCQGDRDRYRFYFFYLKISFIFFIFWVFLCVKFANLYFLRT